MRDPEAIAAGGAGLNQYTPFVQALASLSLQFERPVLQLNGDTHLFLSDRPLANPSSPTGVIHGKLDLLVRLHGERAEHQQHA